MAAPTINGSTMAMAWPCTPLGSAAAHLLPGLPKRFLGSSVMGVTLTSPFTPCARPTIPTSTKSACSADGEGAGAS